MRAIRGLAAPLTALVLLTACVGAPQGEEQPVRRAWAVSSLSGVESENPKIRYTRSDYRLLESLHTADYRDRPLAEFNAALLDWEDETVFHQHEDALCRLSKSLPEDDPLRAFLDGTVNFSWNECQRNHYNACVQGKSPAADGVIDWEEYADVYGDQVEVAWAWGDFWYTYTPDSSVTVGERDDFLNQVSDGMQAYLENCTREQRAAQSAMEKSLLAELKRLTAAYSGTGFTTLNWDVSYQWEEISG